MPFFPDHRAAPGMENHLLTPESEDIELPEEDLPVQPTIKQYLRSAWVPQIRDPYAPGERRPTIVNGYCTEVWRRLDLMNLQPATAKLISVVPVRPGAIAFETRTFLLARPDKDVYVDDRLPTIEDDTVHMPLLGLPDPFLHGLTAAEMDNLVEPSMDIYALTDLIQNMIIRTVSSALLCLGLVSTAAEAEFVNYEPPEGFVLPIATLGLPCISHPDEYFVMVFCVDPCDFGPGDFDNFARPRLVTVLPNGTDKGHWRNPDALWAYIIDSCERMNCNRFVVTTYEQFALGTFCNLECDLVGMSGVLTVPIRTFDGSPSDWPWGGPEMLEMLVWWCSPASVYFRGKDADVGSSSKRLTAGAEHVHDDDHDGLTDIEDNENEEPPTASVPSRAPNGDVGSSPKRPSKRPRANIETDGDHDGLTDIESEEESEPTTKRART